MPRKTPSVLRALYAALRATRTTADCDLALVALAKGYAAAIDDDPDCVEKIGPLLLAALVELRMTPKARAAVVKGGGQGDNGKRAALHVLRDEHDARTRTD